MASTKSSTVTTWKMHHHNFLTIIGSNPTLNVIESLCEYAFAHKGGVYFPDANQLFVTSERFLDGAGAEQVAISKLSLFADRTTPPVLEELENTNIRMARGGVKDGDCVLFCGQDSKTQRCGLYMMSRERPHHAEPVVTDFNGHPFSSVNDVVISRDGCIWFTDRPEGLVQDDRSPPSLPPRVYRYDPQDKSIKALASFGRPNGLCFSPDESILYVTDADHCQGEGPVNRAKASAIFAFDVHCNHGQTSLVHRRLFAFPDKGVPDNIKCDTNGNIYCGCDDAIHVWSPSGLLLGKILLPEGGANFCFGESGEMFILNGDHVLRAQLDGSVKGASPGN